MKKYLCLFGLIFICNPITFVQSAIEQEIKKLSMDKWQWMAEKEVSKLDDLFDDKARFVQMSGSWKKDRELEIIETGSI